MLPANVQSVTFADAPVSLNIPAPWSARFPVNVQWVIVGAPSKLYIPAPPHALLPTPATPEKLSVNVQFVTVGDELRFAIPPPRIAALPLKMQLLTVGFPPLLYIPPPTSGPIGHPYSPEALPPVTVNPSK